jgi:hypothetical protein
MFEKSEAETTALPAVEAMCVRPCARLCANAHLEAEDD